MAVHWVNKPALQFQYNRLRDDVCPMTGTTHWLRNLTTHRARDSDLTVKVFCTVAAVLVLAGFLGIARAAFRDESAGSRRRGPVDYGGGLFLMPDPELERSYASWAIDTWANWEKGHSTWSLGGGSACPKCAHVYSAEQAAFLGSRHPDKAAVKRWRNHQAIAEAQAAALGACRCGQKMSPGDAAQQAHDSLSRWV
jgi:hypothetical protein